MNPMAVGLNFRMFLTNYRNISLVGEPKFPIRLGVDVALQTQPTSSTTQTTTSQAQKLTAAGASTLSTVPLRGLIHDNADEWTGPQPEEPPEEDPQEVEELIAAAVEEAAKNASNMNSVDSIMDSGLGDAGEGTGGPTPDVGPSGASCAAYGTCQDNPYGGVGQMVCRGTDGVVRPVCPDYFDKVQEAADKQGAIFSG